MKAKDGAVSRLMVEMCKKLDKVQQKDAERHAKYPKQGDVWVSRLTSNCVVLAVRHDSVIICRALKTPEFIPGAAAIKCKLEFDKSKIETMSKENFAKLYKSEHGYFGKVYQRAYPNAIIDFVLNEPSDF